MPYTYEYPRPALTVDCVVFGLDEEDLKVVLIQRDLEPFAGKWALPGGFVHVDESLEEAARRELQEEAGLSKVFLEQLYTFGDVKRDPRERVVTVAYYALVNIRDHRVQAATDARNAAWFAVSDTPSLAFDHQKILQRPWNGSRARFATSRSASSCCRPSSRSRSFSIFTRRSWSGRWTSETSVERSGDGFSEETDEIEKDVAHRAARLYRFNEAKYRKLVKKGFLFEVIP